MGDEEMRRILEESENVAVVGLSTNPAKDSHRVARYLQEVGYRIIPVNPFAEEVLGEKAFSSLQEVPHRIDVVDVFRPSEEAGEIARSALEVNARALWLQLGIVSQEAKGIAEQGGMDFIMDRCMMREHRRLF